MEFSSELVGLGFLFGIVSAKWALDLGYSQLSQLVHFVVGLFLGPLVLFILYVRMIYAKKNKNRA
ncbi:MAG: hypothetical protein HWE27_16100 [Gammaproteobacteria bacterium]|nr:hypothetical protein [Gammaproteobacteria bacterium]